MRKILHERKFHRGMGTTGYVLYDDGLAEYYAGNRCTGADAIPYALRVSGTLVEQVNGTCTQYNAHMTLGFHVATMILFKIYGKDYRLYERVTKCYGQMPGKENPDLSDIDRRMIEYNEKLDTLKTKKKKQEYMAQALKAIFEAANIKN